jgi:hypothetical protein
VTICVLVPMELIVEDPAFHTAVDHPALTADTVREVDVDGWPMAEIRSFVPADGVYGPAVHAVSDVASFVAAPAEATAISEPVISKRRMERS